MTRLILLRVEVEDQHFVKQEIQVDLEVEELMHLQDEQYLEEQVMNPQLLLLKVIQVVQLFQELRDHVHKLVVVEQVVLVLIQLHLMQQVILVDLVVLV